MTRMRTMGGGNMFEMENYEFSLGLSEFEVPDVSTGGRGEHLVGDLLLTV